MNILNWSRSITESFKRFINYMKNIQVNPQDIEYLYYDIHREPIDSYMLLVMPRIVKFDSDVSTKETNPLAFFKQLVEFIQRTKSFSKIQFNLFLQPRKFDTVPKVKYQTNWDLGLSPESEAFIQIEKLDRSLEPYRSMFKVEPINLVKYDIFQNKLIDLRPNYYQTYCGLSSDKKTFLKEKISMIENYLVGVEWLYQYYIKGLHLEYSGWFYHHIHPPLVADIVRYLSLHPKCQPKLTKILNSYPSNNLTPQQNYLMVTPNNYTQAGLNPNISDIKDCIDGYGATYINRAQINWNAIFNV
jgi:5'-3' exonuclease